MIDENNISFKFNLLRALDGYIDLSTDFLKKIVNHSIENLLTEEKAKLEMTQRMKEILLNLIDYNQINENEKYLENIKNRFLKKKN